MYFPLFLQSMKLTSFDAQIPESLDMKEQKSATNITYLRVSAKEEKRLFSEGNLVGNIYFTFGDFWAIFRPKKDFDYRGRD